MSSSSIETKLQEIQAELSDKIADLDDRVAMLSARVESVAPTPDAAWWKRIVGVYANDPLFDEAERLGRRWRESISSSSGED